MVLNLRPRLFLQVYFYCQFDIVLYKSKYPSAMDEVDR
jgi:hypothetical protein